MVESCLHGNSTAPRLTLGPLCSIAVMESPLGARQLVIGCVLSSGTAAFSCTLHPSHLPVYSCAHTVQLEMQFAAASLFPSSLPSTGTMYTDILPGTRMYKSTMVLMVLGGDGETGAQNYSVCVGGRGG